MLTAFCLIAIAALAVLLLAAAHTSRSINRSKKRTYADRYFITPYELNVPFQNVEFRAEDGVLLRGWWMPGPSGRVIIGCSGLNGSKADLIGIGTYLWRAGNGVLLFDCRDRGESDMAPRSAGYRETGDLGAAISYVRMQIAGARIGVIGFSMGASVVVMAAAKDRDVRAVVADSPYASLAEIITGAYRRWCLPSRLLMFLADLFNQLAYGYRLSEIRPIDAVHRISPRPLLLIHGSSDSVIPADHSRRLFAKAGEPRQLWIADGVEHCGAYFLDREIYCKRVADFFDRAFAGGAPES
jgi:fermentation-respiration switch protein FrsA (DUF1100 family)